MKKYQDALNGILFEIRQYCKALNLIPEETTFTLISGSEKEC